MDNISQWLAQARASGLSDTQIREQLQKSGWNDGQINQLFVGPPPSAQMSPGAAPQYVAVGQNMFSRTWETVKHSLVPYIVFGLISVAAILIINLVLFPLLKGSANLLLWFISYIVMGLAFAFVYYGSAVVMVSDDKRIGATLSATLKSFLKFFVTYILATIVILGGFMLFFIPGIFMSLAFALLPFVVAKENIWGMAALKRCYILARGHRGTIFVSLIVLSVIFFIIGFGFSMLLFGAALFSPENSDAAIAWTGGAGIIFIAILYILSPLLQSAIIAVIYRDLGTMRPAGVEQEVGEKGKKFMIGYMVFGVFATILLTWGIFSFISTVPDLLNSSVSDLTNTSGFLNTNSNDVDSQRTLDVYNIWANLDDYNSENNSYPASLTDIADRFSDNLVPVDPVSGEAYYYETTGSDFVLCAKIETDTTGTPWCLDANYDFVCDTIDQTTGKPLCDWNVPYTQVQ